MRRRRRIAAGVGAAALLFVVFLAATPLPRQPAAFTRLEWIGPLNVVDAETGTVAPRRALRMEGKRIAAIVPFDALPAEARARLTDGGGAFAVAGLWDMHSVLTRYAPSIEHPLYLAHGVTRLRNVINCPSEGAANLYPCQSHKARWNSHVHAGKLAGPLVMGSGSYPVNGPAKRHRDTPASFAVGSPKGARALVRELARQPHRPDHIKTYDRLPRASFFALMGEARRRGIEVSGHVPVSVSAAEASAAGLKAIAHARILPIACSSREAEIIRLRSAGRPAAEWMRIALASQDPAKCAAFWRLLKANGTFVSPTLITRYSETKRGLAELGSDPAMKRATPWLVKLVWREDAAPIEARGGAEDALYRLFYEAAAARTAEAEQAGVRLLLGSDTNDLYVAPGVGLHQEMAIWRRAGIPAAAILRAGTLNAAAYFGRHGNIGRVAPGQVADLVLTERNPLEALGTLRTPRAVIQEGRLYRRGELQAMTEEAEGAAGSWRYTVHVLRDFLRNPMGFAD